METSPDSSIENRILPFKTDDIITWKDEETATTFNRPAFGHGTGPFKVIDVKPSGFIDYVIITFINAKGVKTRMNSDHFRKALT